MDALRSTFTWLDYSEHERRRMLDVIHAFDEKGTRDELGIGTIRDGLADLLFPGTGTVQTRAKYFLLIPWVYVDLEAKGIPSMAIADKARGREIELIAALEKGGEKTGGIIGIEARANLQRLPSNIYWQGLGVWGIRRFSGSQGQYHRALDGWYESKRDRQPTDRGENYDDGSVRLNWHPTIPEPPDGWRWNTTFRLTKEEARFLRDCILHRTTGSLLAHLVILNQRLGDAEFCWASERHRDFPFTNRQQVAHAQNFSELMHGAALMYNLLLGERSGKSDLEAGYREDIQTWSETILKSGKRLASWDTGAFWALFREQGVRVPRPTFNFVSEWIRRVLGARDPAKLADDKQVRQLIRNREIELKKGLARLESARALELWNGAAGTGRLDFRWQVTRQIVNDVLEGLGYA